MITPRRSEDRGHANHGWLDANHTFSFAGYFDPEWIQFGELRVLNQDRIAPGMGFGTHGHEDMEIVTYVLEGSLEHRDSMGTGSRLTPGMVQLMSAGSGVTHSEFNGSREEELHLLQMWVMPAERGTRPRYEECQFEELEQVTGRLHLVVSPDGRDGSLSIGQDARLFAGRFAAGESSTHELAPGRMAWLHLARGRMRVGDTELGAGDGAAIREEEALLLRGLEDSELVLWDLSLA